MNRFSHVFLFALFFFSSLKGQQAPWHQQTIMPQKIVNAFIDEVSGEIALQHCIEMAAYNRNRLAEEYQNNFLETDYVMQKAREIGLQNVQLENFEADSIWDGEFAELWEVSPRKNRKIADYDDQTAVLVRGSQSADITAELVYIGAGSNADFDSLDVKDKIVFGFGSVGRMYFQAVVKHGALGVVGFSTRGVTEGTTAIPWSGIYGRGRGRGENSGGFAFLLDFRRGLQLQQRLLRGEKIKVHAIVKASLQPRKNQVISAEITGSEKPEESIIFSAHLFEGIVKQGANDDISGSAVLLEIGRTILELMNRGIIERPKRTVRFLWVPEFSGTIPWVKKHHDLIENTLVNLNLDMVGIKLSTNHSRFNLERTPFSRPSYLNDVVENVMNYVRETNWETLHSRALLNPIIAPTGSLDPFYCKIDYHYGASDHVVFNDWGVGVPGIMLITWPDNWYHTSEDRPTNLDPTQLKRAGFISALSGYIIADADDATVIRLCPVIFSHAVKRMGNEFRRGTDLLNSAEDENLVSTFKLSKTILNVAKNLEKATLLSTLELSSGKNSVRKHVNSYVRSLEKKVSPEFVNRLNEQYRIICSLKGKKPLSPKLTALEKKAAKIFPSPTEKVKGYFQRKWISDAVERSVQDSLTTVSYRVTRELRNLINGKRSALEITNILSAEFSKPTEVQDVLNYLELLKLASLVKM